MRMMTFRRNGLTLIELCVVIAIIAIVLGLLLVAISRARESAARVASQNKLKQIILATHSYAATNNSRLPSFDGNAQSSNAGVPLFIAILPFIDGVLYNYLLNTSDPYPPIEYFISPADPTASEGITAGEGLCSYPANAEVFQENPRLPFSISDGTSNTIAFAEHYSYRCGGDSGSSFLYWLPFNSGGSRTPTFAETGVITSGTPPVSSGYNAGETFQIAPSQLNCNPYLTQTPHSSGMLVALVDGSVRTLEGSMLEATFWGAITPASGEVPGPDW